MDRKIITKVIAAILAFILSFANVAILGIYTQEVYAANIQLEEQSTKVEKANIEFDAYFLQEGEMKHSKAVDIRANNERLNLRLKISEGYLADASIKLENANFKLKKTEEELELVQDIDKENGVITLNKIDKGESVVLEIPIEMNTDSDFDVQSLNQTSKLILNGTYVNNKSKEIKISKEIEVSANITAESTANIEETVSKYVPFDVNGTKGVVLQTSVKAKLLDNILPVKQTEMNIEIPKINGVEPNTIALSAISTKATNGKANKIFKEEEYTYKDGIVSLTIKNEANENGKVSWEKNAEDEIIVTAVYGEKAITRETEIDLKADANITLYNNEEKVVKAVKDEKVTLNKEIGNLVTFDLKLSKDTFEKGQMLVAGSQNIAFTEIIEANIGNRELVDSLVIDSKMNYLDTNQNNYPSNTLYTYTKVDGENLVEMLGEDGYINVLDKNGEKIATLNKDNLEYKYEKETTYIKLETSKVQSEGILKIENGREIKSAEYDKEQTKIFTQAEEKISAKAIYKNQELLNTEVSKKVALAEPKSVIETGINKANLSTSTNNEKVELRVVLNTNDVNKSLYKNPTVRIVLPAYIEGFTDGKIGLLYEKELKLGKTATYRNENGNIVIDIPMVGEQTTFNTSSVSNGATILVYANLKVNELAPRINDVIKVYVTNENETVYEKEENGMGVSNIDIKYAAQSKVITRNTMTAVNQEAKALNENKIAAIDSRAEAKTATVKLDIVNSTSKDIKNVMILGRTPFEGNKSVLSGNDLNSKFTASMINKIAASYGVDANNITIYYSEVENATRDLQNSENGWTTDVKDLSKVKSYLITFGENIIKLGDRVSFEYNVQIPENLDGEIGTYSTFAVYYSEVEEVAETMPMRRMARAAANTDTATNTIKTEESYSAGLVTTKASEIPSSEKTETPSVSGETKPQENFTPFTAQELGIEVTRTSSGQAITNEQTVKEGQYVDYLVTMQNRTENKTLVFDLEVSKENGTFYILHIGDYSSRDHSPLHEYAEVADEKLVERITIKPGEKTTFKYALVANKGATNTNLGTTISVKQNDNVIASSSFSNEITSGLVKLNINYNHFEETLAYTGVNLALVADVTNITDTRLNNVEVSLDIPEPLSFFDYAFFRESSDYDDYKQDGNTVRFTINSLDAGKTARIYISLDTEDIPKYEQSKDFSFMAKATVNKQEYLSNVYEKTIYQGGTYLLAKMSGSVLSEEVKHGDELTYIIEIENLGKVDEINLKIQDNVPKGIKVKDYTVIKPDGSEKTTNTNYNTIFVNDLELKAGEKITLKIRGEVNENLMKGTDIVNYATVTGNYISETMTNMVTYKLKRTASQEEPATPVDPEDPETPKDPDTPLKPVDPSTPSKPEDPNDPSKPDKPTSETFTISGRVWSDTNSDGKRDSDEKGIAGIEVMLMNNQKSEFVKDKSGKEINAKTDADGAYKFEGLVSGEYVVVFAYDTAAYAPTTYQKQGVYTTVNSDAIDGTIKMNGTSAKVAVTDIINIGQASQENIDLGLIPANKFDLKIEKVVNTVIVQNKQGTKTYTFKNNKTAKVEIPSKYMPGSNLTIEYKITVTNEGDVSGKVSKIVDYLPKGLTFSPEINSEWYIGADGNLYTEGLADTEIKPGETKDITLVVTKTLKAAEAEITTNSAEIAEYYNGLGLEDIDSTPGNKSQKEDDLSLAELIITIKTGAMTYTLIVLGIVGLIAILGTGIYFIKKKVLETRV